MKAERYRQIILFKTYADLRAERSRTYLGFAWWLFEPLLLMLVFYVVFVRIMKRGGEDFLPFLLIGLILWQWFRATISHSAGSILQARGLVREVVLPVSIFPLVTVATDAAKFAATLVVLFVVLWATGNLPGTAYIALPLVLAAELLLIVGISLLVAAVVPFIPDLRFVIDPLLHAMFFLSGIFFAIDDLAPTARQLILWNPMAGLIDAARDILLRDQWPDFSYLAVIFLVGMALAAAGIALTRRLGPRYPKLPM